MTGRRHVIATAKSATFEGRRFRRLLLKWFDENARDLPWRRTRDPYSIWVSEIMLQQTRVAAVKEHYALFMERFPTLTALAKAREDEVLTCWSGLGYYRRARMLLLAAQFVVRELHGKLPSTAVELRSLPGIGDYTSAAIASIGFGQAIACVDGNVERVLTRVRGWTERTAVAGRIRKAAAEVLDRSRPGDFNQAMMELGATVCLPRGPLCLHCPVVELCATRGEHPVQARKKMRSQKAAYAFLLRIAEPVVKKAGRKKKNGQAARPAELAVLLEQRPADASLMPGMWELPEIDAAKADAARRLLDVRHSITVTNYYVTVYGYDASVESKLPDSKGVRKWVNSRELAELPLTGLTRKVLKRLKTLPGYTGPGPAVTFDEVTPELWV
jgi:A/G-specific adenine glycosylase